MMYFHISDLAAIKQGFMSKQSYEEYYKETGTLFKRFKRYFKDNFSLGNTFAKFTSVIKNNHLMNLEYIDKSIIENNVNVNKVHI